MGLGLSGSNGSGDGDLALMKMFVAMMIMMGAELAMDVAI